MRTQTHSLAVGERAGRTVCNVADRHQSRDAAAERRRFGRGSEKVVQPTAFVGLDVGERDMAQARCGHHGFDRFADQWKHAPGAGVKEQRLIVRDEILIGTWDTGVLMR